MARNDWQDNLAALVARSSGSLSEGAADALTRLLRTGSGAAAHEDRAIPVAPGGTAAPERRLAGAAEGLIGQASGLSERLAELVRATQSQARSVEDNTAALSQQTASRVADTVKAVTGSLGGFSPLSAGPAFLPLISGLAKLFGGGGEKAAPEAAPFTLPAPLRVEAGVSGQGLGEIRYDAGGTPRAVTPAPQIHISVQAMDSRSFLDHSEEIARAVREAMLESHALSDVVGEW